MAIAPGDRTHLRPKPKKKAVKRSTAPPRQADQGDRSRSNPAPQAPPAKVRMFANPGRPKPRAVIKKAAKEQAAEARKERAEKRETRRVVRRLSKTVKPAPSPDARDTERSPEQRKRDADVRDKNVRESRVKALVKRRRGAVSRGVKKFLEGGLTVNPGVGANTGTGPTVLVKGRKRGGGGMQFAAMKPHVPRGVKIDGKTVAGRFAKDMANLPAQVVPSVYVPAAGVVEAAQGRPERIKKFAKDIDETDVVYNLAAAGANAAKGNKKAAKKRLKKAGSAASEHPGFAVAEVVGAKGTLGRGSGAVMRHSPSKRARKVASTKRKARTLPGTSLREDRRYSPDVITKGAQVAVEKVQRKRAVKARTKAAKVEKASPDEAARLREKAARVDPDRNISEKEIQKRVDEHVDAQETVRRMHRGETVNEARRVAKDVKDAGPVGNLLAQGIVRADVNDIKAYIAELKGERPSLTNAGKRANRELVRGLDKALVASSKGKVDLKALEPVVARYRASQAKREQELAKREMLPSDDAALAAAKPYAVRRMGAKWDKKDGLVNRRGVPLTLADVRAHMKKNGEPEPSWLSQSPTARGAHNFFQSSSRAPGIQTGRRTGEATRGGTFDAHPDTLVEGAAKQQGLVDAFDGFHEYLNEFAMKGKGGKIRTLQTRKQVEAAVREAMVDSDGKPRPGAVKFVAVRVNPFGGRKEQLAKLLDGTDDASLGGVQYLNDAINDALKGTGDGPWALVPEAAARRLQEHVRVLNPGNLGKAGQKANSMFRKTVLSTSIPWMLGNMTEGAMRATLAQAGPRSYMTGRRVLKRARELDKEKGERSSARTVGGGHFGSVERQHNHLNVDAMNPGQMKKVATALGAFWRIGEGKSKAIPSPASAAALWQGYTHVVMNVVNRALENQIQTAMLGRAVHGSDLMDAPLVKATNAAVDKAAKGLLDQNTAASLGRQVDRMYGRYGKFSPDMRKAIALYTPFVAWTINSTYFLLRTLPRDHPTALLLIAAATNATDEWRKEHGLDKFIEGHVPGWLQGSIPGPGGSHFRAPNRYTPFSLGADPLDTYAAAVLPMLTGVLAAGKGKTWQGRDLSDDSDFGKAKAAIHSILGSTVPALAVGERVVTKGPKAAVVDTAIGKVAPSSGKKKVRRSGRKPKAGRIVGAGAGSGGKIVGPGVGSGGGKIVRP